MTEKEIELSKLLALIQNDLEKWGAFVDKTLNDVLLSRLSFEVKILPTHRIKSQRSFLDKALYRKQNYNDPINEIDDKVGTRIVMLKSSDVLEVAELIKAHDQWTSKVTKDIYQIIADQPKIFDYQSIHIVVYPKSGEIELANNYRYGCEIQIRTLLQHAFAEVSHDSTYKGPYRYDHGILRQLSKSMALMESTDDYFMRIYELMSDPERKYAAILKGLTYIYQQFVLDFKQTDLNVELSDRLMVLVRERDAALTDIEAYVEKRKTEFIRAIKRSNGLLFHQPISILVGYFLLRYPDTLDKYWPLNRELLNDVYMAFNYSPGSY